MPGARLSLEEREAISRGLVEHRSLTSIAVGLGRPCSTISREVARNGGRWRYRAVAAQRATRRRARRPKQRKLVGCAGLAAVVSDRLEQRWSPQQIAARLRRERPGRRDWQVSHETIYQALFLQGRGGLRRELHQALRTGRARRRPGPTPGRGSRGKIVDPVLISERPAEVADRAVPGHWEGDLIIGRAKKTAVATIVERASRFVLLAALPHGRTAEAVRDAVAAQMTTLPLALRRSLTWDQGKEMARHKEFTIATGIDIYFCDPRSPWQRGTNENTNGLLRQYLPKTSDMPTDQATLNTIADELNGRPRQTLNWMTPSEKLTEFLATTT